MFFSISPVFRRGVLFGYCCWVCGGETVRAGASLAGAGVAAGATGSCASRVPLGVCRTRPPSFRLSDMHVTARALMNIPCKSVVNVLPYRDRSPRWNVSGVVRSLASGPLCRAFLSSGALAPQPSPCVLCDPRRPFPSHSRHKKMTESECQSSAGPVAVRHRTPCIDRHAQITPDFHVMPPSERRERADSWSAGWWYDRRRWGRARSSSSGSRHASSDKD